MSGVTIATHGRYSHGTFGLSTTTAVIGLRRTVYHESIGMAALGVMVAVVGLLR